MHHRNTAPESVCVCVCARLKQPSVIASDTCRTHASPKKPQCDGSYYDCVVVITVVMLMVEEDAVEVGLLL